MIKEQVSQFSWQGFILCFLCLCFIANVIWIFMGDNSERTVKKMPHKYDGLSPLEALHDMEKRIMMLEDGIMGLIKRCDNIELGDNRESISKRLDHLGKWISKIDEKLKKLEGGNEDM